MSDDDHSSTGEYSAPADRGWKLGSPCQNDHTINREDARFWMTCGDETIATATFTDSAVRYEDQPRAWSEMMMARHEIACWKALLREVKVELSRWGWGDFHYGDQPQEPRVVALVDRANAALREGSYADG